MLRHFNLDFNFRTTIQIIGKELNIRYFYMVLFLTCKSINKFLNRS
ncbi:helix-turn-helix domain-containing protein [Paenibacillus alvei]|nr:helix-turn-helix domain-containing protein [Paenibacillus alvei]